MSEPRETARQIADKTPEQRAWHIAWSPDLDINDEHRDAVQAAIATEIASLTADLAQARQEHAGEIANFQASLNRAGQLVAAAEQARDEALKERDIARSELAGLARDLDERNQSAARTALLEAAEAIENGDGGWFFAPRDDVRAIVQWLRTRADKEHPHG